MIHLIAVEKGFGPKTLFHGADLHIGPDERIGLVGPNGSGKTTLFRLLIRETSPDAGEIRFRKGLRVGYLPQEVQPMREGRVLQTVVAGVRGLGELKRERDALLREMQAPTSEATASALARRHAEVEERFERAGGYTIESEAREVLSGLGFLKERFEQRLDTLSGGWHVRVELARLLLDRPELLLLDEPTNHLDLESIQWFEQYLATFKGSFVLVSHDREFLNRAVNRIVEVKRDGLRSYSGNYDTYRRRSAEDLVLLEKRYKEQQTRVRELQDFIDRNRVRKDRARQVQSRLKALEQIELIDPPRNEGGIRFRFPRPERSGDSVVELKGVSQRYGDNEVLRPFDLTVRRGWRVGIVGLNGAGKSTLLKIMAARLEPTTGVRRLGTNVTVDYYAQHQLEALDPESTVLQEMMRLADVGTAATVRGLLGAFHFSGDEVDKPVSVLSGGEKARLALAKMLLWPANLLLLDEPTNHLDIASREVLERALAEYDGTLCLTSHDRRFLDVVVNTIFEVKDGYIDVIPGNFSHYLWKKSHETQPHDAPTPRDRKKVTKPTTDETGRTRALERERKRREAQLRERLSRELKPLKEQVAKLERAVTKGEQAIKRLADAMADPALYRDTEKARGVAAEHDAIQKRLDELCDEWERLQCELENKEKLIDNDPR